MMTSPSDAVDVDHRCLACGKVHQDAREVTLHDGTVVSSYSEAWRAECEARAVVNMATLQQRRDYLAGVEKKRGPASAQELRRHVARLWEAIRQPTAA